MKKVSVISNVLSIAAIIFLFILDYLFMSVGYIMKNVLILALILLSSAEIGRASCRERV